MWRRGGIGIVLGVMLLGTPATAGGPPSRGPSGPGHFLHRLAPAGGWHPDGGGLFHWWDPDCFARYCTPDDYCRKPLPRMHCAPRPACVVHAHGHHECTGCLGMH